MMHTPHTHTHNTERERHTHTHNTHTNTSTFFLDLLCLASAAIDRQVRRACVPHRGRGDRTQGTVNALPWRWWYPGCFRVTCCSVFLLCVCVLFCPVSTLHSNGTQKYIRLHVALQIAAVACPQSLLRHHITASLPLPHPHHHRDAQPAAGLCCTFSSR